MDTIRRRTFVRGAAAGALAFTVGGVEVLLLPSEARAQKVPLKVLTADEALRLEAVSETLVPGAREAGIAHFVDQQCSVPPHEALLEHPHRQRAPAVRELLSRGAERDRRRVQRRARQAVRAS